MNRQVKRAGESERSREKLGSVSVNATPVYFSSAARQSLKILYSVSSFFPFVSPTTKLPRT